MGMVSLRPGKYRHPVTVQQRTRTDDGMMTARETWSVYANDRAAIWPVTAKQRISLGETELEISHRIRMRYRSGITKNMRIKKNDDGRIFRISSVINVDERNRELDILCMEIA